jgi:Homeodomain-like domain
VGCGLSEAHIRPEVLVSHRNALTTFHGRLLIVERYLAGWAKAHIAEAIGISRQCLHTRISRFESEGQTGLIDYNTERRHSSLGGLPPISRLRPT